MSQLKKMIPQTWKTAYKQHKAKVYFSKFSASLKDQKKIFILGVPEFINVGDCAIAYAEMEFLKKFFPEEILIEIPSQFVPYIQFLFKKILNEEDLVMEQGGGNIGNIYKGDHISIIDKIDSQQIIYFPQTSTFSKDNEGDGARNIFSKKFSIMGKKLTITARENSTFDDFKQLFPTNNIILTPDIVLSLNKRKQIKRQDILVCLRNDIEQTIPDNLKQDIIINLQKKYKNINISDTVVNYNITIKKREESLEKKWDEFRKARVVITDRLHGLIFSVITGTPCIALDNFNGKVSSTYYTWLSHYKNIQVIRKDDISDFKNILNLIDEVIDQEVPNFEIGNKYDLLLKAISNARK
ncbi:polysaccharide pyruvyl transferase family protein [Lactococcus lactis]|uniref:polysaccharide pyruvyl transferase family protein n=1 Tax=Lactococcus lactis TaxID=1358 RepID=UPI00288E83B7|nr:polysaccharide pyruvyl transferase family protein [Lactococcus lactis]MDT2895508.1 polysaccharide pyruvyl transferase family protein [Lactococcus lactis]